MGPFIFNGYIIEDESGEPVIKDIEEPAGEYTAYGKIIDKIGNPIADVIIQVGEKKIITDEAGNWEIPKLQEGNYIVTKWL